MALPLTAIPDGNPNSHIWHDPVMDKWYFTDETGDEHGPYNSRKAAVKHLGKYCYWLDHGPTLWQKIWWPIRNWFNG